MTFYEPDAGAERIAVAYDQRLVPWLFEHWADRLIAIAEPARSAQVLDLACGTGLLARTLLGCLGDEGHVYGVDADASMLAYAARTTSDPRVSWHEADATRIPIEASTVDLVVCNQGLQFFPEPTTVFAEISRVLRPGGPLALAVWGPLEHNPWLNERRPRRRARRRRPPWERECLRPRRPRTGPPTAHRCGLR